MRLGTFAFSPVLPRGSNFQIFEDSRKAAVREELRRHLLTALHCSADGRACLSSHRRRHGQSTAAGVDLAVTRRTVLEPPQLGGTGAGEALLRRGLQRHRVRKE